MKTENERLKTLLYNAISLLTDETLEQYDDKEDWKEMIYNELVTTKEELLDFRVIFFFFFFLCNHMRKHYVYSN